MRHSFAFEFSLFYLSLLLLDMGSELEQFLMTVKGSGPEGRVRKAMAFLESKEVYSQDDLEGCDFGRVMAHSDGSAVSTGLESFLHKAVKKATEEAQKLEAREAEEAREAREAHVPGTPLGLLGGSPATPGGLPPTGGDILQCLHSLGIKEEKKVEKVHIDLGTHVAQIDLKSLPQPNWPKSKATDDLATEMKRLKNKGIWSPYVYCELKDFLPFWAEFKDVDVESDVDEDMSSSFKALASVLEKKFGGGSAKPKKRLDVVRWSAAFDKFALSGAMVDYQLTFAAALAHKDVCMNVGLTAPLGVVARRAGLGPIYDEVCRKNWADRSHSGEQGFDFNQSALVLDRVLLKHAEDVYDAAGRHDSGAKSGGKGGIQFPVCVLCDVVLN